MSMPTIPPEPHRPNLKEVTIDLLESIALEEIALSHLINAESEKIQAFVGECLNFPTCPTNKEIIKFNKGVSELLETIVMKEWLLLKKFDNVLEFYDSLVCCNEPHQKKCKKDCRCKKCVACHLPKCDCRCPQLRPLTHDSK